MMTSYGELESLNDDIKDKMNGDLAKDETKNMILELSGFSSRLESVLLALLRDQEILRGDFVREKEFRDNEVAKMKEDRNIQELEWKNLLQDASDKLGASLESSIGQVRGDMGSLEQRLADADKGLEEGLAKMNSEWNEKLQTSEDKLVEKMSYDVGRLDSDVQELRDKSQKLSEALDNQIKDCASQLRNDLDAEKEEREELKRDMKMALEEEKMLRNQDHEILKLKLNEGLSGMKEVLGQDLDELQKVLNEEREERIVQGDNLSDRLDKEASNRKSALENFKADLGHEVEEAQRAIFENANHLKEELTEKVKMVAEDVEKTQKSLETVNKSLSNSLQATVDKLEKDLQVESNLIGKEMKQLHDKLSHELEDLNSIIQTESKVSEAQYADTMDKLAEAKAQTEALLQDSEAKLNELLEQEKESRINDVQDLKAKWDEDLMGMKQDSDGMKQQLSGEVESLTRSVEEVKVDLQKEIADTRADMEAEISQRSDGEDKIRDLVHEAAKDSEARLESLHSDLHSKLDTTRAELCQDIEARAGNIADRLEEFQGANELKCNELSEKLDEEKQQRVETVNSALGSLEQVQGDLSAELKLEISSIQDALNLAKDKSEQDLAVAQDAFQQEADKLRAQAKEMDEKLDSKSDQLMGQIHQVKSDQTEKMSEAMDVIETKLCDHQNAREILKQDLLGQIKTSEEHLNHVVNVEKNERVLEIEETQNNLEKLFADINAKVDKNDDLLKKLSSDNFSQLYADIEKLKDNLSTSESRLGGEMRELFGKNSTDIGEERDKRQSEIDSLIRHVGNDNIELKELVASENQQLRAAIAEEMKSRKGDVLELEDRLGEIFKALCNNIKQEMDGNRKDLEEMLDKEKEAIAALEQNSKDSLAAAIQGLSGDLESKSSESQDGIKAVLENLEQVKSENDQATSELREALENEKLDRISERDRIVDNESSQVASLEAAIAELRNSLKEEQEANLKVKSGLEEQLERTIGSIKGDMDKDREGLDQQMSTHFGSLQAELKANSDSLQELMDKVNENRRNDEELKQNQLKSIEDQLTEKLSQACEDLSKNLKSERQLLDEAIQSENQQRAELSQQLQLFQQSTNDNLGKICSQVVGFEKDKQGHTDEISCLKEQFQSFQGVLDQERREADLKLAESSESLISKFESELKALAEGLLKGEEQLEMDKRSLLSNIERLESGIKVDRDKLMDQLTQNLKELEQKLASENMGHQSKNDILMDKLEQDNKKLTFLLEESERKAKQDMDGICEGIKKEMQEKLEQEALRHEQEKQDLERQLEDVQDKKKGILTALQQLQDENWVWKQKTEQLDQQLIKDRESSVMSINSISEQVQAQIAKDLAAQANKSEQQITDIQSLQEEVESLKNCSNDMKSLKDVMTKMELLMHLPMSVYFNAIREKPYTGGGEEYLTFDSCTCNAGGGMDASSGVFTAPLNGAYLFSFSVCSHDMKKVLIAMKRNNVEIASVYDQNHVDNHKNSMSSQTLVTELLKGDKIQLYLYTFTGIFDKSGNHLTHFSGLLLRPVESLTLSGVTEGGALPPEKPRKRLVMSNEPAARKKISVIS